MGNYIIPVIFFLAPLVFTFFALRYHKKTNEQNPFAWGFVFFVFLAGWGIALGVLGWNLGWWG